MGGLALAWLTGEGIIVYRWVKHKAPPPPGALLEASLLFVALGVLAQYEPARTAAALFGWGIDIAVLMQVIGKEPKVTPSWPPLCIPDTQLMPSKTAGVPCGAAQTPASSSSATSTGTGAKKKIPTPAGTKPIIGQR
jgi:hypothetical protein